MSAPAPKGLGGLAGVQTYVNANAFDNVDFAAHALSLAENVGASINYFVTTPAVALELATVKELASSQRPLLGADVNNGTSRSILGVPLLVSPYVAADTLWALDSSRCWLIVREPARVEVDHSVLFTSDRVAVKATIRVGFVHPASVVRVSLA